MAYSSEDFDEYGLFDDSGDLDKEEYYDELEEEDLYDDGTIAE